MVSLVGSTGCALHDVHRSGVDAQGEDAVARERTRAAIASARDSVFPALVHIQVVATYFADGKEVKRRAAGSGTIITPQGHVLTNQHVTDSGRRFRCTLANKREVSADLVAEDPLTDLAVLKLNLQELPESERTLPVARFGDSASLAVGDTVLAMGSPWALSRSVTLGIVSNAERVFAGDQDTDVDDMRLRRGQQTGLFTRWIQHDAAINPGNSGGPLVNLRGEVIGVNELGNLLGGDMGFAIPANLAQDVATELIAHGEVIRSWVGLSFKPIEKTGLAEGVLINTVVGGSPAALAGLEPGDVLLRVDGHPVTVRFAEQVPPLLGDLAKRAVGSEVGVAYVRDGTERRATLTTARWQKDRGDELAFRSWGLSATHITPWLAREQQMDSTAGALVTGVRPGGSAALADPPLAPDDVIRAVDGKPVDDLEGLAKVYASTMEQDPVPEFVLVEFDRQGRSYVTLVKPKPEEDHDPPPELPKAWIGVAVQPVVQALAERFGLDKQTGFRITQVYPHTQAAGTDLMVGDIITHLNGEPLRPKRTEDAGLFHREVRRLELDEQAKLSLLRGGEARTVRLPLERTRIAPEEARRDRNRDFDLTVREITFFDRVENRWGEDTRGVIVQNVEFAGWAGLGGIVPGDLIQRIERSVVSDLDTYRAAMQELTLREPERVVFFVLRGVRTRFQYLEPDWSPGGDGSPGRQDAD